MAPSPEGACQLISSSATLRLATIGYGAAAPFPGRYRASGPCKRNHQLSPQAGPATYRDGSSTRVAPRGDFSYTGPRSWRVYLVVAYDTPGSNRLYRLIPADVSSCSDLRVL